MTRKLFHSVLAITMSFALVCPQAVQAATVVDGIQVSTTVKDLAMKNGVVQGALVDANGKPIAGQPAVIAQQGKTLAIKATDAQGRYSFENLTPGVYQVATNAGIQTYRVWDASSAPATADKGIIQVAGDDVVRGACCSDPGCDGCDGIGGHRGGIFGGKLSGALANPTVVVLGAAAVAAAIAIPLALDDDDDNDAS